MMLKTKGRSSNQAHDQLAGMLLYYAGDNCEVVRKFLPMRGFSPNKPQVRVISGCDTEIYRRRFVNCALNLQLPWGILLLYCRCMTTRMTNVDSSDADSVFNVSFLNVSM